MDVGNFISMEQRQLLSQSQIQALEILAMDNVELNAYMQNEYLENPLIDYNAKSETPGSMQEFQSRYDKNRFSHKGEEAAFHEEEQNGYEIAVPQQNSIRDVIMNQINQWEHSKEEIRIIEYLIDCLDNNGFMNIESSEIARLNHVETKIVEKCLEDLRQLEPYGIFAQDLPHCLLRQLEVMDVSDPILEKIILHHLQDIGEGRISIISRELHLSTLQVRKYTALIGHLNPKPLSGYSDGNNSYIVPDIILTYTDQQWNVSLNDNWIGDYKLSDYYMKLMGEAKDEELFEYFKGKLERARFVMRSIEQRRDTVMKIANAITKWQGDYFLGKGTLKPMNMVEIASEIGVHPFTISRGIKGKYLQYPGGTISIKNLFVASVTGEKNSDAAITADQVKKIIRELVDREDRKHPLSDQKLTQQLAEKEIHVSRRVVAKYREELGIRGSFERKEVD